jgi:hypothetical protein
MCRMLHPVGEFRALVDVAERDRALCDTLKRVLKLSKARGHDSCFVAVPAGWPHCIHVYEDTNAIQQRYELVCRSVKQQ